MSDPSSSGEPSSAPPSLSGGGDFALDIGDDLLAEALAAVEARTRKPRPATPAEMEAFAADLDVDPPEALDLDDELDPADDDAVVFEPADEVDDEAEGALAGPDAAPMEPEEDAAAGLDAVLDLESELADLQSALDAALDRADLLEDQLAQERARLEAAAEATREQLTADKRKAMALARRWKERAERAEARLEMARSSRDEAAERALKAEGAVQRAEARRDDDLARASERRRKELAEVRQAAPGKVLSELLPPIDHLSLAVIHAHEEPERVVEGLEMIVGQFGAALARLGVERVEAEPGQAFSPDCHEAFAAEAAEGLEPGSIVREVTAGYRLQGRLLRAARVIVAAAAPEAEVEPEAEAEGAPEAEAEDPPPADESLLLAPAPLPPGDADETLDAALSAADVPDDAPDDDVPDDDAPDDDAPDDGPSPA